ncbi:type VII secretion-associated serine protease mycosin [Antrihabitans cavernicola]|uniref:type VII secretion-associated serine protease mycosin n=1 Tax=Antrihabitans cavernicola TaxID=2495913 RepID=UPI001F3AF14D|nr:type VII secretion-associated serine protease mycosin [Spelaeibacter cavernicola]
MSSRSRLHRAARIVTVGAVLTLSASLGQGTSFADRPPPIDPGRLPADGQPSPPEKTELRNKCLNTVKSTPGPEIPTAQRDLNFQAAWKFTKGAGQTVAVIDTGVAKHPRLPGLIPGGDYVGDSDGTDDCDVHGTVVAGLIAASQVNGDGFSGVAPEARIMTIRQSSDAWQEATSADRPKEGENAEGYGNVNTMAAAVVHAANMGATVINISEVACSTTTMNDGALGAAVQYASLVKNVVVVAAAGNNDHCQTPNPGLDPLHPNGDRWDRVATIVTPAWYDDYVLAVGSVDNQGAPSKFTVAGPWVDVAAPGESVTSLDARGTGLATQKVGDQGGPASFTGTSFAAPFVSGTVALVRARFPQLTAQQVISRIEATAHAPAEGWNPSVGHGVIDPYAAVTDEVPLTGSPTDAPHSEQLAAPAVPAPPNHGPRNAALIGSSIIGVLLLLGVLASFPLRRRFQFPAVPDDGRAAGESSGATPS